MEKYIQPIADNNYFFLSQPTDESARLDKCYAKQLKQCSKCLTYQMPPNSMPVVLQYVPARLSITFVWDTNLTLVSKRLLVAIKAALSTNNMGLFETCDVELQGNKDSDYVGFRCKYHVLVRGSEHVRYFACPECGNVAYVAFGRRYLVGPIDRSIPLFGAGAGRIVTHETIVASLRPLNFQLDLEDLHIETEPCDGLPTDLRVIKV